MAYTARLTKQQLRQRRDATRDRSRDNTKGTVHYLVTYAYTNNNCLLCASNIIVSVAIPTISAYVYFCIVLYSSIYIAPLNSHRQTEALLVRLAPRKETSFKK